MLIADLFHIRKTQLMSNALCELTLLEYNYEIIVANDSTMKFLDEDPNPTQDNEHMIATSQWIQEGGKVSEGWFNVQGELRADTLWTQMVVYNHEIFMQ